MPEDDLARALRLSAEEAGCASNQLLIGQTRGRERSALSQPLSHHFKRSAPRRCPQGHALEQATATHAGEPCAWQCDGILLLFLLALTLPLALPLITRLRRGFLWELRLRTEGKGRAVVEENLLARADVGEHRAERRQPDALEHESERRVPDQAFH